MAELNAGRAFTYTNAARLTQFTDDAAQFLVEGFAGSAGLRAIGGAVSTGITIAADEIHDFGRRMYLHATEPVTNLRPGTLSAAATPRIEHVKLVGLSQNRKLRSLSDAQIINTFKNTDLSFTGHSLKRLRDDRLLGLGVETPNDIARILNKGSYYESSQPNSFGRHLDGVAVVLDSKTLELITVTPVASKSRAF